jgi:hypothetical protein
MSTPVPEINIIHVPSMLFAILIVPIFDITRVFFYRITNGGSPFMPDRSHLHHVLLRYGFGHRSVAVMISGLTVGLTTMSLAATVMGTNLFIGLSVLLILVFTSRLFLTPFARYYHSFMGNTVVLGDSPRDLR